MYFACSSGLGMFHYGLMFGNPVLIFINALGVTMQIVYISLFILVSANKVNSQRFVIFHLLQEAAQYGGRGG